MRSKVSRSANLALRATALLLAMATAGCASLSHPYPKRFVPKTEFISAPSRVAVASPLQMPEINVDGLGGWREGSLLGAKRALQFCYGYDTDVFDRGCGSAYGCAAVLLIMTGCAAVATPVAAVAGAVKAPNAQAKETIKVPLTERAIQETLRDRVIATARDQGLQFAVIPSAETIDYPAFAGKGIDTVLEIAVTHLALKGADDDPPLTLTMQAHARVIRTRTGDEIFFDDYFYEGATHTLTDWSANRAELLTREMNSVYESMASAIYEHILSSAVSK